MRRFVYNWLVLAFAIGVTWAAGAPIVHADVYHDDDPETSEVVVKLNLASNTTIEAINAEFGTTTIEELVGTSAIYRLRVPDGKDAEDVAEDLQDDARVLYAEPNYNSEAPEGNPRHIGAWGGPVDDVLAQQSALNLLGLADAHEFTQGEGVVVAVLDTGFQLDHPDLVNSWTTARYDFIEDDEDPTDVANGQDNDGDGHVDEAFGHGTHVAGIVHLAAPDARIMPVRVLEADGRGNIFVIAEAIQYAVDNGADVINLSLGSPQESELMGEILEDVVEYEDIVVVAAAGNLNSEAEQFPASEDEVLAVTSIDADSHKSEFANYGEWIDVAAPGEAIISAFPVSDHAAWSGTSMAVPFVAAHAALLQSAVPSMNAGQITAYIRASAQSLDVLNPDVSGGLGAGRINIGGSIRAICAENGVCSAPDVTGTLILESRAVVESRPSAGLLGNWIIGGHSYIADASTEFRQDAGALATGVCADVEYLNTSPYTALEIRSREADQCPDGPQEPQLDQMIYLPLVNN